MRLNASKLDLKMDQVFAFPDQCQMLLKKADTLFFSNTVETRDDAALLYTRLIDRLSFLAVLKEEESKLATAYKRIESEWGLTVAAMPTLKSVYEQAKSRLNRMLLGQDMWGHVSDWVPRLSIQFYNVRLDPQMELLKIEEGLIGLYEDHWQKGNDTTAEVKKGIDLMGSQKRAAEAKIKLLTDENGPLVMSIDKIRAFTPQLKAKRIEISRKLRDVNFNPEAFDPKLIIDFLSALVETKFGFKTLTKLAALGYDTYKDRTTTKDMKGEKVEKDYIIDQLAEWAGDLDALQAAFSTRKDQTIEVDDPACIKILTTIENIKKLVAEFKKAFPSDWREDLSKHLDEYVKLIKTRNDAVMEYNVAVQLLAEALNDRTYREEQAAKLGQKGLQINKNLPAILYWLRKSWDGLSLTIMQNLNYQARAIRYWGLQENVTMLKPEPLQGVVWLKEQRNQLDAAFTRSLEQYSTNVRNIWPARNDQRGHFRRLTSNEIATLKNSGTKDSKGKMEYNLWVNVDTELDRTTFRDGIDIRLSQVRLWLLGVDVKEDNVERKLASVQLIHLGEEVIQDAYMKNHALSHDRVTIQFDYDAGKVHTIDDMSTKYVFSKQQIQDDHYIGTKATDSSIAALGPFTMWRVRLRESANAGLDLKGLHDAYLEFHGTSRVNQALKPSPGDVRCE